MNKYILLLRGNNVGGKNKVPMKELLEKNGFQDVVTYINSGNIKNTPCTLLNAYWIQKL